LACAQNQPAAHPRISQTDSGELWSTHPYDKGPNSAPGTVRLVVMFPWTIRREPISLMTKT
jgi:hypothetical protein